MAINGQQSEASSQNGNLEVVMWCIATGQRTQKLLMIICDKRKALCKTSLAYSIFVKIHKGFVKNCENNLMYGVTVQIRMPYFIY